MKIKYNRKTYEFSHFAFKKNYETNKIKNVYLFQQLKGATPGSVELIHNCTKISEDFRLLSLIDFSKLIPTKIYSVENLLEEKENGL